MKDFEEARAKMLAAQAKHKASLQGIDLMQYNLYMKLRGWVLRETANRVVGICEMVEKVQKYAPKTILKSREQFEYAVKKLFSGTHGYDIDSEDYLREDLEFEIEPEAEIKLLPVIDVREHTSSEDMKARGKFLPKDYLQKFPVSRFVRK